MSTIKCVRIVVLVVLAATAAAAADSGAGRRLTLIVTSGTGGRLEAPDGATAAELAATIHTLASQARSAGSDVLVLDAGRTLAPYAESRFDGGRMMLEVLAAAGVQVFAPSAMDLGAAGSDLAARLAGLGLEPALPFAAGGGGRGAVVVTLGDGLRVAVADLIDPVELANAALSGDPQPQTAAEAFADVGPALRLAVVQSGGHGRDITSRSLTWRLVEEPDGIDLLLDPDLGYTVQLERRGPGGDVALVGRDRDGRDPWAVARIELELVRDASGWAVAGLETSEIAAGALGTPDPDLEARIRRHMAAFRTDLGRPLPPGAPTDRAGLEAFVLAAMRERAGAEVTILNRGGLRPVDPARFEHPPLHFEVVMRLLSLDQELALVELTGADLRHLVEASVQRVGLDGEPRADSLCFAGLDWTLTDDGVVADLEVNGRPLREADRYRVATTTFLLDGGDDYPPLQRAEALELPGGRPLEVRDDVVLPRLQRAAEPFRDLTRLAVWRTGVARLGLDLSGVEADHDPAYDDVSDSRAAAASSASGRVELDAYAMRVLPAWRWENMLRSRYAVVDTADAPREEVDDDLRLDSSVVFTAASVPGGGSPYASVIVDTELARNRAEDGTLLPRQLEQSLSAGLTWSTEHWPRLRFGGVVRRYGNEERADQSGLLAEVLYHAEPAGEGFRPGLDGRLYLESLWGGGRRVARFDLDLRLLVPMFHRLNLVPAVNWYSYDDSTLPGSARSLRYSLGLAWSFATRSHPRPRP